MVIESELKLAIRATLTARGKEWSGKERQRTVYERQQETGDVLRLAPVAGIIPLHVMAELFLHCIMHTPDNRTYSSLSLECLVESAVPGIGGPLQAAKDACCRSSSHAVIDLSISRAQLSI